MRYSERLRRIEQEIHRGETMADVGTDHGFLPIRLYSQGICPSVIMTDISPDSLRKAEEDWALYLSEDDGTHASFRVGSGLEPLQPGEVDAVVIAGMGGLLMTEILSKDLPKTKSYRRFIFQPRNNVGMLRDWLLRNGFRIEREQIVEEGRFLCEIVTASPINPADCSGTMVLAETVESAEQVGVYNLDPVYTAQCDYPESLLLTGEPMLVEYLQRRLRGQARVYDGLLHSGDQMDSEKAEKNQLTKAIVKARIEQLEHLLEAAGKESK